MGREFVDGDGMSLILAQDFRLGQWRGAEHPLSESGMPSRTTSFLSQL